MATLPTDLVHFIQSGVSIIVAVVGAYGRAQTGRALAARVVASDSVRLPYPAAGNALATHAAPLTAALTPP